MPTSLPDSNRERDTPAHPSQNSNSTQIESENSPAHFVPLNFPGCPSNFTEIRLCFEDKSEPSSRFIDTSTCSFEGDDSRETDHSDECERQKGNKTDNEVYEYSEGDQIGNDDLVNSEGDQIGNDVLVNSEGDQIGNDVLVNSEGDQISNDVLVNSEGDQINNDVLVNSEGDQISNDVLVNSEGDQINNDVLVNSEGDQISNDVLVINEFTEGDTDAAVNNECTPAFLTDCGQIVDSVTTKSRHKPRAKVRGAVPKPATFSQPSVQTNVHHAFKEKELYTPRMFCNTTSPHQLSSMCDIRFRKKSSEKGSVTKLTACPRLRSKSDGRAHIHKTEGRYLEGIGSTNAPVRASISTARLDYHHSPEKESAQGDTKYTQNNEKPKTGEKYHECQTLPEKEIFKLLAASTNPTSLESQTPPCSDALFDLGLRKGSPIPQVHCNTHRSPSRDWSRTKGPRSIDRMFVDVMKILVSLENHPTKYSTPAFEAEEDEFKAPDFFTHLNQTANQWRQKEDTVLEANNSEDSNILIDAGPKNISKGTLRGSLRDITDIFDRSKLRLVLGTNEDDEYVCQCCIVKNHHRSRDNNNCHYFFDDDDDYDNNDEHVSARTAFNAATSSNGSPEQSFGSNENINSRVNEDSDRQSSQMKEPKFRGFVSSLQEKLPSYQTSGVSTDQSKDADKLWQHPESLTNSPLRAEEADPKLASMSDERRSSQVRSVLTNGQFEYPNEEYSILTRTEAGRLELDSHLNDVGVINPSHSTECCQENCCLSESSRITCLNLQHEQVAQVRNKITRPGKYEESRNTRFQVESSRNNHLSSDKSVNDNVDGNSSKEVADHLMQPTHQYKGTHACQDQNIAADASKEPVQPCSGSAQSLDDCGLDCGSIPLVDDKPPRLSQLANTKVTEHNDTLKIQKLVHVNEHLAKRKKNATLEESGAYFEYPNPVISSCSTGKAALVSAVKNRCPGFDVTHYLGNTKADYTKARSRSLSPVMAKITGVVDRFKRGRGLTKKSESFSDLDTDLPIDIVNLTSTNVHILDICHSEALVMPDTAGISQEDNRITRNSNNVPALTTSSRTSSTSGDDHPPIFCLEIVNTGSVRKKCKQHYRNQESFSSIMSREMKNQHNSWLADAQPIDCSQLQCLQTEIEFDNHQPNREGSDWKIEDDYLHKYCSEEEEDESWHSGKCQSFQSEPYNNLRDNEEAVHQYQRLEEHQMGAPVEATRRLLHFRSIATKSDSIEKFDPTDVQFAESYFESDEEKDDIAEVDVSKSCNSIEQTSLVFREVSSYEQSDQRAHSISSPSSDTNCRTEWEDLFLNDDVFNALTPGKSCSLVNTNEIARTESVTDAMALLLEEVSIKRYPSYPDLTSLTNSDIRFISDSSPELVACRRREHFIDTKQMPHTFCIKSFDPSPTFLRGSHVSGSPLRTRTLINKPPLRAVSQTNLPPRLPQSDEHGPRKHSNQKIIIPKPCLLCRRHQDLATCCSGCCCIKFSRSEIQKTSLSALTGDDCDESQKFNAHIVGHNRAVNLTLGTDLPSPPDYSFSGNSWGSQSSGSQTDESSIDEMNLSHVDRQYVQSTSKMSSVPNLAVSNHRLKLLRAAVTNEKTSLATDINSGQASKTIEPVNEMHVLDNSNAALLVNVHACYKTNDSQLSLPFISSENSKGYTNNALVENLSHLHYVRTLRDVQLNNNSNNQVLNHRGQNNIQAEFVASDTVAGDKVADSISVQCCQKQDVGCSSDEHSSDEHNSDEHNSDEHNSDEHNSDEHNSDEHNSADNEEHHTFWPVCSVSADQDSDLDLDRGKHYDSHVKTLSPPNSVLAEQEECRKKASPQQLLIVNQTDEPHNLIHI